MTWRQHVVYDPAMASQNRWRLADSGDGIRVRFRMASEPDRVVDLTLDEAKLRAIDGDTFCSAPQKSADWDGAIEFVLRGAPEPIVLALRQALANANTDPPPAA